MALSRWSGGQLSTFSVIQNTYHERVDPYRILFTERVNRMREIADELQKVTTEFKETRERSVEGLKAGLVTGVVGLGLAALTAPFTGGLSLAIYGAATLGSLAGTAASLHHSKTGIKNDRKMAVQQKLTAEFWTIAESASEDLDGMMKACEYVKTQSDGAEKEEIIKLEIKMLMDFLRKTQLQISATGHHVKAVADKYQEALIGLKAIKRTITIIDRNSR